MTGVPPPHETWRLGPALFLRALGAVHVAAFGSLWVQIHGLVGANGIAPAAEYLAQVQALVGVRGLALVPTVFWVDASDRALSIACGAGVALGAVVAAGRMRAPALAILWLLYLSICSVGRDFLGFQWDALLLEATFLGVFLAPWRPGGPPGALAAFLLRVLLARLVFASAFVKLASGDPVWRTLSALDFHYETQPLPTPVAFVAHQLPHALQVLSTALVFAIEFFAPPLLFGPRPVRRASAAAIAGLMGLIAITGNFGVFNALTAALCLVAVDDGAFPRALGERGRTPAPEWPKGAARALYFAGAGAWLLVTAAVFAQSLGLSRVAFASGVLERIEPLRTVNGYGLFAVMTTTRDEIRIEGSEDGAQWREYVLPWKPGDPAARPPLVAPHLPRLDWMLWFAALGPCTRSEWLASLEARLLEGSPDVVALFASNPFPEGPPKLVRTFIARYRFATIEERLQGGAWWKVDEARPFCPLAER